MAKLESLAPKEKLRVIDLVRSAGVDVSDWANIKGGKQRASVNPKYCYEWAFVQPHKVVVLCIWFDSLKEKAGKIWCDLNERKNADWVSQLSSTDPRRRRRLKMDAALHTAFQDGLPVRLIIVSGIHRRLDEELKASQVKKRSLDAAPWAVTAYDFETGQGVLTRDVAPSAPGVPDALAATAIHSATLSHLVDNIASEIEASAGFQPNAKIRKVVEQHAMERAAEEFRKRGYEVKDVSKRKPFDLLCTRASEKKYVEVKGMQGRGSEIILTAGEVKFIQNNGANHILCVVQDIRVRGKKDPTARGGALDITEPFDIASGLLTPLAYMFRPIRR
jgi:hypothetical protein